MNDNNIESFVNFTENTNTIFSNIIQVINSQQNTYNTIFNNSYNRRYNDRNVYTRGYSRDNNVNTNLSRNILQQTLLRNLIFRSASLANTENNIPTEEQITNSTTRTTFQEIENPINTTCPISQSDFSNNDIVLQINHCGHIFSERPLLQWFNINHCCPMCRYSIISDSSNKSIDEDTELNNITRNNNRNNNQNNNGNISRNSSTSTINRNNSDPNITRNNSCSNSNFNRVPIITRINSSPNRFNSFNNFNSNVNNNTISNDMLNQLQTIIDTFNNEIEFEVTLITPS